MADIRKITDFGASQLDIYARIPEVQLLHFHEPGRVSLSQKAPM